MKQVRIGFVGGGDATEAIEDLKVSRQSIRLRFGK
jgi:hypothetical protein